ncbi:MAG TPA: ABC transporter permease subunit [Streptosporangiaceae bacterium]|nr:ABC transporter permease subunit [Streptosporangiaceae bacterium]
MTTTSYRSVRPAGRDGFGQLLRAEWTKLRTVRGWVLTIFLAAALTAAVPIFLASTAKSNDPVTCAHGICQAEGQTIAVGPADTAVVDNFYFADQPLASDGSIIARVSGLHGVSRLPPGFARAPATMPWAKAGLIIKASTKPGAAYAAVMLTGGHGVRMQYDFTHEIAGTSAVSAQWLRLTRSGGSVTGFESADGRQWTEIGTAVLPGLTGTAQVGLFVASPTFQAAFGSGDNSVGIATHAVASFGHITLSGGQPAGHWTGTQVGTPSADGAINFSVNGHPVKGPVTQPGSVRAVAGTITVSGSGDIAPFEPIVDPLHVTFFGTLFGLIALIALGALFVTAEYRRGLIRTTVAASPRRGRILVAKSIIIGVVAFLAGLIGGAVALPIASRKLYANDWRPPVWPQLSLTSGIGLRIVLGTAAIAAVATVLGLAAGAIFRRGTGAIVVTTGVVIVPLILALVMPLTLATWLLRLSPAAAFSVQSSVQRYPQVSNVCAPYHSCFPLSPWHGFAVLCVWAAVALGVAIYALRRRDV